MKGKKYRKLNFIILTFLIIFGSFLRFYKIEKESLWNDELASWERSNQNSLKGVLHESHSDVHPPGYYILLFFVIKFFGDSEFWLRLPSAIAGILSIFFIYLLGKKIYSPWEALISSGLMAFLWFPIYYSQEARVYSLLLLFSIIIFYLWIILIENGKGGRAYLFNSLFFILSSAITSYLHYFGLMFVILLGIGTFLLFLKKKKVLLFLLLYTIILILYIPWIPELIEDFGRREIWIKKEWVFPTTLFLYHFFNKSKLLFFSALILYFINPVYYFLKNIKEKRKPTLKLDFYTWALILWLIIPFILTFTKSLISTPVITIRNLIISLPPAYLLLSRSITRLKIKTSLKIFITLFLFAFSLLHLFYGIYYYSKPFKEQFREATFFLTENYSLFDNSLIIGYAWSKNHLNYYLKRKGFEREVEYIFGEEMDIKNLEIVLSKRKPKYIWYIRAHRIPNPEFKKYMFRNFKTILHASFIECEVWLFKLKHQ